VPVEGGAGERRLGDHGVEGQLAERVLAEELDGCVAYLPVGLLFAGRAPVPAAWSDSWSEEKQ